MEEHRDVKTEKKVWKYGYKIATLYKRLKQPPEHYLGKHNPTPTKEQCLSFFTFHIIYCPL